MEPIEQEQEYNEGKPNAVEVVPVVEIEQEQEYTIGPKEIIPANPFLTRGCCKAPQDLQRGETVFEHGCCKLDAYDWLKDITLATRQRGFDCVEVRFKNNRKDFFRLPGDLDLYMGDIVAVEASPGHDIGVVTLTGEVVKLQMRKRRIDPDSADIKKVYRKARLTDIEKWISAVSKEDNTLHRARKIASELNLKMKINDIEFQGDDTKCIFYYTADDRVDFREMIKLLAEQFRVRIEMRQIGVRQEASRLGGVGSCGRELCCSTWLTSFESVTTNAARVQQLSLNPQKLAGQCGKLKCCLNYEYDSYVDALENFPDNTITLKTKKGDAIHQKTDIFKRIMWYSYSNDQQKLMMMDATKVAQIIEMNKNGEIPANLEELAIKQVAKAEEQLVNNDDLRRIDS
jgi:cell fate regulator YaaT (PSP1 superfamily)